MKLNNTGALTTKVFVKAPDGRTIPFLTIDELNMREEVENANAQRAVELAEKAAEATDEMDEGDRVGEDDPMRASHTELKAAGSIQSIVAASALDSAGGLRPKSVGFESEPDRRSSDSVAFDEFIS